MLKIFICEDNAVQRASIENLIKNYVMMEDLDVEIALSTDNPQAVIDYLHHTPTSMGLYFLDVDLNHELNGMLLGKELRRLDITGKIVFITTHGELMHLTFTYLIEAMDYIVKGSDFEEIKYKVISCLNLAYKHFLAASKSAEANVFAIKTGTSTRLIPLDEIMFFETGSVHKLIINLENAQIEFHQTMREVLASNNKFVRIHNSYVVNAENIKLIDRERRELEMINGQKCPISIKGMKELEKKLKKQKTIREK